MSVAITNAGKHVSASQYKTQSTSSTTDLKAHTVLRSAHTGSAYKLSSETQCNLGIAGARLSHDTSLRGPTT